MRFFYFLFFLFFVNAVIAQELDRNFYSNQAQTMIACNSKSDITNVRAGPSAKSFKKVSELINGQHVDVLERLLNKDGYDYYKIVYYEELGGGRLYENTGYVYHNTLAKTCDVNFKKVVAKNQTWPVSIRWWGCGFEMANEETLKQWDRISSKLRLFGMSGAAKGLCKESQDYKISVKRYLGHYKADNRDYFQLKLNGCDTQFSIKDNREDETYSYGWRYDPACLAKINAQNSQKASNSKSIGFGDLLSLAFAGGVHGLAAINGTTSEELLSNTQKQNPFCYSIDNEDARYACLGQPHSTNNRDARKILLGDCYGLSNKANDIGLREVCVGVSTQSCLSIANTDHAFSCNTCGGTRQWSAVYAAGTTLTCYK